MRYVLDTNVVLYLLTGRLAEPLPEGQFSVSVMTELELLGYQALTDAQEQVVRQFLGDVSIIELGEDVRRATISLRKKHRIKLPDAIIVASAQVSAARLLTADAQLARLGEVEVVIPPIR